MPHGDPKNGHFGEGLAGTKMWNIDNEFENYFCSDENQKIAKIHLSLTGR